MRADPSIKEDLRQLLEFAMGPWATDFVRGAALAYFGENAPPLDKAPPGFADYVLFAHRDEDRRSLHNHFEVKVIDREGVLARLRRSELGLFQVEQATESTAILRRIGGDGQTAVLLPQDPGLELEPGAAIVTRVVSTGRGNVLAGVFGAASAAVADFARSLAEKPENLRLLKDPLFLYRVTSDGPEEGKHSDDRLEVQLRAARVLERLGIPFTVEEVEEELQTKASATELLCSLPSYVPAKNAEAVRDLTAVISALWNHTPRREFEGQSPIERHARLESQRRVHPETLPAMNRRVWPSERLQELLNSGKQASAAWALSYLAEERGEAENLDFIPAVELLLRSENDELPLRALLDLRELRSAPKRMELAQCVERFCASCKDDYLRATAVEVQAALDPIGHSDPLRRLCEKEETAGCNPFLTLAEIGGPEDAELILRSIPRLKSFEPAINALAALIHLRDAPRTRQGLGALLQEHLLTGGDPLAYFCDQMLEAVCSGSSIRHGAGALFRKGLVPEDTDKDLKSLLRPQAGTAARDRSLRALPEDRLEGLEDLAARRQVSKLVYTLRDITLDAVRLASEDHPPFAPLGEVIRALTEAVATPQFVRLLDRKDQEILGSMLLGLLASSIRGWDLKRELKVARPETGKLLELAAVDANWVDEDIFRKLVAAAPPQLLELLADQPDDEVRGLADWALAAKLPESHFRAKLIDQERDFDFLRFVWSVALLGDAVLPWIVDAANSYPRNEDLPFALFLAIKTLGTEQARSYLEANLDLLLRPSGQLEAVISAAQATGSRSTAELLARVIRSGEVDVNSHIEAWAMVTKNELTLELNMLFEICGFECDADELLQQAERKQRVSLQRGNEADPGSLKHSDSAWDEEEDRDVHEHVCDDPTHHHHHYHQHGSGRDPGGFEPAHAPGSLNRGTRLAPLVREAAKVGRNDPCPCGSGKKHKKCCEK